MKLKICKNVKYLEKNMCLTTVDNIRILRLYNS